MFIHWDHCNRIHEGNNFINIRRTHTVLCTPLLPRTPMVWLGTCSFSRSEQPRRTDWKSLPIKNTWFFGYWRKMWSCDTVFHKTTSLECSGKIFFLLRWTCEWILSFHFVMVPIEALVHPLCVIPNSSGNRDIYFVVLPKLNWSQFFGERIIITTNI
jgi:hypothetical protein